MTTNPLINALGALLYICAVASVMYYSGKLASPPPGILAPIAVLSLFTLSAAVMGYMFLSQPLRLYLDNDKQPAVTLFLNTLAIFAGITVLLLLILFSRSFA